MRIYLVGFMGCGKSSFGRRLAKKLDYYFLDLDDEVEFKTGKTIDEIFKMDGENAFRLIEQEVLRETLVHKNTIIATGGGTPCYADNMDFMNSEGVTVYLRMSAVSIKHRLELARRVRPLVKGLTGDALLEFVRKKLTEREQWYLKSHCVIKGETVKPDHVISLVFG